MKLTNDQAVTAYNALLEMARLQATDVKVSYKLNRNLRKLRGPAELYQGEFGKLIDRYGERDDAGNLRYVASERVKLTDPKAFERESLELDAIELELDLWPIGLADLEKLPGVTGSHMFRLGPILLEEELTDNGSKPRKRGRKGDGEGEAK